MGLQLSEIFIYPIKSLGGISLKQSVVEPRGLRYDRRMMLINEHGEFITQRDYPQKALFKTSIEENFVIVKNSLTGESININHNHISGDSINVTIWNDSCKALRVSAEADSYFSDHLGLRCSLVYMPDDEKRIVDSSKKYVTDEHIVSFADGYPFLIIGQSSLNELNKKLNVPVPMNRFRPNFVFTGGDAFEEDSWKDFFIGNLKFRAVKPCDRCVITTTNQDTAERNEEPLKTLSTFRKFGNKVLFGMNVISYSTGIVSVGDKINLHYEKQTREKL